MKTPTSPRAARKPIAAWLTLALLGAAGGESWAVEDGKRGTARRAQPGVVAKQPVAAAKPAPGNAAQRGEPRAGMAAPGQVRKVNSKRLEDLARPRLRNAAQAQAGAAEVKRPAPAAPKRDDARVAAKPVAGAQRAVAPSMIDRLQAPVLQSRRGVRAKPVAQAAGAARIGASLSTASTGELPYVGAGVGNADHADHGSSDVQGEVPDRCARERMGSEHAPVNANPAALTWVPAMDAADAMLGAVEAGPGAHDRAAVQRARDLFEAQKAKAPDDRPFDSESVNRWLQSGGLKVVGVSRVETAEWLEKNGADFNPETDHERWAYLERFKADVAQSIAKGQRSLGAQSTAGVVIVRFNPALPYQALPERQRLLFAIARRGGSGEYVVVHHDPSTDTAREVRIAGGLGAEHDAVRVGPGDPALKYVTHAVYAPLAVAGEPLAGQPRFEALPAGEASARMQPAPQRQGLDAEAVPRLEQPDARAGVASAVMHANQAPSQSHALLAASGWTQLSAKDAAATALSAIKASLSEQDRTSLLHADNALRTIREAIDIGVSDEPSSLTQWLMDNGFSMFKFDTTDRRVQSQLGLTRWIARAQAEGGYDATGQFIRFEPALRFRKLPMRERLVLAVICFTHEVGGATQYSYAVVRPDPHTRQPREVGPDGQMLDSQAAADGSLNAARVMFAFYAPLGDHLAGKPKRGQVIAPKHRGRDERIAIESLVDQVIRRVGRPPADAATLQAKLAELPSGSEFASFQSVWQGIGLEYANVVPQHEGPSGMADAIRTMRASRTGYVPELGALVLRPCRPMSFDDLPDRERILAVVARGVGLGGGFNGYIVAVPTELEVRKGSKLVWIIDEYAPEHESGRRYLSDSMVRSTSAALSNIAYVVYAP